MLPAIPEKYWNAKKDKNKERVQQLQGTQPDY